MGKRFVFTAEVNVFDEKALRLAAYRHGRASGAGANYVPASIEEALQMVMDTGPDLSPSEMGFEIEHSSVEVA